jgi:hypothetical protein
MFFLAIEYVVGAGLTVRGATFARGHYLRVGRDAQRRSIKSVRSSSVLIRVFSLRHPPRLSVSAVGKPHNNANRGDAETKRQR